MSCEGSRLRIWSEGFLAIHFLDVKSTVHIVPSNRLTILPRPGLSEDAKLIEGHRSQNWSKIRACSVSFRYTVSRVGMKRPLSEHALGLPNLGKTSVTSLTWRPFQIRVWPRKLPFWAGGQCDHDGAKCRYKNLFIIRSPPIY